MKFTPAQKEDIYEKYMTRIDVIADELENKVHFSPKEIITILLNIIETEDYDNTRKS
jgi:hypothetical protein